MIVIRLGGPCSVTIDDRSPGAPPSEATMILLCGLAYRGDSWSHRDEIAKKLYPGTDRSHRANALRQTVFRLRRWLPVPVIETSGNLIRLRPGLWSLDTTLDGETDGSRGGIAIGIDHPWIDEIRLKLCSSPKEMESPLMQGFTDSVRRLAEFDVNAARRLFVSATDVADLFSLEDLLQIVAVVRPQKLTDPHAADFYALYAWIAYRTGMFAEAVRQARLAFQSKPSRKTGLSMALLMFYASIERNDEAGVLEARRLMSDFQRDESLDSADMCLYWNFGLLDEARQSRDRAMRSVRKYSRSEKLMFLLNTAYFSADVGDLAIAKEALDEVDLILRPNQDPLSLTLSYNAKAKVMILLREAEEAQRSITLAQKSSKEFGRLLQDVYIQETRSEVSRALGQHETARIQWSTFLRQRRALGVGVTDRLRRQQERVLV